MCLKNAEMLFVASAFSDEITLEGWLKPLTMMMFSGLEKAKTPVDRLARASICYHNKTPMRIKLKILLSSWDMSSSMSGQEGMEGRAVSLSPLNWCK